MMPEPGSIEQIVVIGVRKLEDRPCWNWLVAAGVALGIGSTAAIVHHYDQSHPQQAAASMQELAGALQAVRPRLGR